MKIKKGTYRFAASNGWKTEEGSYAVCYPFFIHRKTKSKLWSLSHLATGYSVKTALTLKDAKTLAKYLESFSLFLVPTLETFTKQLEIHKRKHPLKHAEMIRRITGK